MKTGFLITFVPMAALLAIAGVSAGPAQDPPPAFARVCSKCHDGTRIVEGRRLRSQWEETLEKMTALGATGTDEDFEAILDYLVRVHGRVIWRRAKEGTSKGKRLPAGLAIEFVEGIDDDLEALFAYLGLP